MGGTSAARLRCSAVKYIVDSYRCSPMSTRALDRTILRSSAKCSGVFMKQVEGVLGADFVKVVLGVVVESYQHAMRLSLPIIATKVLPSSVIYRCPLSLIFMHCYQVVAIGRRVRI